MYRMLAAQTEDDYNPSGPPPPPLRIPSTQTAFVSPPQIPGLPSHPGLVAGSMYSAALRAPPPTGLVITAPPPPGPPPPPPGPSATKSCLSSSPMHATEAKRFERTQSPISEARSDLLAAIRMGKHTSRILRLSCVWLW